MAGFRVTVVGTTVLIMGRPGADHHDDFKLSHHTWIPASGRLGYYDDDILRCSLGHPVSRLSPLRRHSEDSVPDPGGPSRGGRPGQPAIIMTATGTSAESHLPVGSESFQKSYPYNVFLLRLGLGRPSPHCGHAAD